MWQALLCSLRAEGAGAAGRAALSAPRAGFEALHRYSLEHGTEWEMCWEMDRRSRTHA